MNPSSSPKPEDTNGWNRNIENLLKSWSQQISDIVTIHNDKGKLCQKLYMIFGGILILFQTGSLVTLINNVATTAINSKYNITDPTQQAQYNQDRIDSMNNLIYAITAINIFILVVQGLNTFFNWGTGAEKHFSAANEVNALSRLISITLTLKRKDRDPAKDVLNSVRTQFDDIMKNSPIQNVPALTVPAPTKEIKEIKLNFKTRTITPTDIKEKNDDSDAEEISNSYKSKFMTEFQKQKLESARENSKGVLGNLQYQWQRFEEMSETPKGKGDEQV